MFFHLLLPPIPYWSIFRYIPAYLFWPLVILIVGLVVIVLIKGISKLMSDFSAGMLIIFLALVFLAAAALIIVNVDTIANFIDRIFRPLFRMV